MSSAATVPSIVSGPSVPTIVLVVFGQPGVVVGRLTEATAAKAATPIRSRLPLPRTLCDCSRSLLGGRVRIAKPSCKLVP